MANKINYTGSSKVIKRICEAINDIIDNGAGVTQSTASATTLSEGSSATVSTSITGNTIDFQFGIPKGDTGAQGPAGPEGAQGPAGQDGVDGQDGVGVPAGGTTGQVLAKRSGSDYDTYWKTESGGGGGGSTVTVQQIQTSGIKIATITVDGNGTDIYAPSGGGSGDDPRMNRTLKIYALNGELHIGGVAI